VPDAAAGPGLGRPHHSAYAVADIEATVGRLVAGLGAGPFLLIEDVPLEEVISAGGPAQLRHHSAFGSCGGYPIELMQVLEAAPESVAARWAPPLPRLHHVGYALAPTAAAAARAELERRGAREYLSSSLGEGRGTFHDLAATLGHDIEIQEESEQLVGFFAMVLAAGEGWDGSDPLRPIA
jgi:methylmalonyl-CoA/ethylmalonyl-CoA epimerase